MEKKSKSWSEENQQLCSTTLCEITREFSIAGLFRQQIHCSVLSSGSLDPQTERDSIIAADAFQLTHAFLFLNYCSGESEDAGIFPAQLCFMQLKKWLNYS